jgi:hypothetical protein
MGNPLRTDVLKYEVKSYNIPLSTVVVVEEICAYFLTARFPSNSHTKVSLLRFIRLNLVAYKLCSTLE